MKIMTVALVRNDESPNEVESIGALASAGYAFHTDADKQADTSKLITDIESAFCRGMHGEYLPELGASPK